MKTRNGFVSNSSSSSFIVALDKIPKSKNDIKKMFYKGVDKSMWFDAEKTIGTNVLSGVIWNDIKKHKPIKSASKIAKIIGRGRLLDHLEPDFEDYVDRKTLKGWDKYQADRDEYAETIAKLFLKFNKKRFIYALTFSDNSGNVQGHLEHGDTFDFVKHLRIDCH